MDYTEHFNKLLEEGASKIDAAYTVIKCMITEDSLEGGKIVSERTLCSQLGVSRTPIRAALNRLTLEGFVEMKGDACAIVTELSVSDILNIYEVREALECKAVEQFVRRRTDEELNRLIQCLQSHKEAVNSGDAAAAREMDDGMHLLIAKGAKNKYLYTLLSNTISLSHRTAAIESSYVPRYNRSLPQHEAIVEAIAAGDAEAAVAAMRGHLEDVRAYFKKQFLMDIQ